MVTKTKIASIGNSAGVILPKKMLDRLKLQEGDTVCLSEATFGVYVTPNDGDRVRKLESTQRIMRQYREALGKLAE